MSDVVIHWFRNDLRVADNPALFEAAQNGSVLPVYIYDTDRADLDADGDMGAASKWWLHHSLNALKKSGVPIYCFKGKPEDVLKTLQEKTGAKGIYWNRLYDPYSINRDKQIKETLSNCHSFNGALLNEPWEIKNNQGSFYKVFTPYWRAAVEKNRHMTDGLPRSVQEKPDITYLDQPIENAIEIKDLDLLPSDHDWHTKFDSHWTPGEKGAKDALKTFLDGPVLSYKTDRDIPSKRGTSRLSPHLHFGEISPHQIWQAVYGVGDQRNEDIKTFLSEIGWREFSYYLLFHGNELKTKPFQEKFTDFTWEENEAHFHAWKKGLTGFPIVDAGMRELWQTGYMHNRVRMIVASFLTKNCLLHWTKGEQWFWDCLVDADPANNVAGWQWVAGCGADAAPFFRIFNPITQSEKFDASGEYIRRYVPELSNFSDKKIHKPFEASDQEQSKAGCIIGKDYPAPILDLKQTRQRALDRFKEI